ncbi:MAG: hypothetical protein IKE65_05565 [Clostridia bacterium]|nr:hypothetical protein [Clostridia bacterium]
MISVIYYLRRLNSPLVVGIYTELFLTFLEPDIKHNKLINAVAGCTFGVYLIHQNMFFKPILMKLFPIYLETNPLLVFTYTVGAVIAICIFCTLVDFVRTKTVEKLWIAFLNTRWVKIEEKIKKTAFALYGSIKKAAIKYYNR